MARPSATTTRSSGSRAPQTIARSRSLSPARARAPSGRLRRSPTPSCASGRSSEAYEVLSKAETRRLYDRYGHAGLVRAASSPASSTSAASPTSSRRSSATTCSAAVARGAPRRRCACRGRDRPPEAARGTTREVPFEVAVACAVRGERSRAGHERRHARAATAPAGAAGLPQRARGVRPDPDLPECGGRGAGRRAPVHGLRRRRAAARGAHARGRDPAGDPRRPADPHLRRGPRGELGGRAGDVYVRVRVRPDPRFVREGNDIYSTVDLTIDEAALGATTRSQTLDGDVELEFQPGTQPGEIGCCAGNGMPVLQGFGRGDQRVLVNVTVPRRLSDEQRRLLQEFEARERRRHVRARRELLREAEERVPLTGVAGRCGPATSAPRRLARRCSSSSPKDSRRSSAARASSSPRTRTRPARNALARLLRRAVEEVEEGWEDRWREFHRPVRVGRLWVGPPWEAPPRGPTGGRDRPRARLRDRGTSDDAALPRAAAGADPSEPARRRLRLGRSRDRGVPCSGIGPCSRVDTEPARSRRRATNAARNGVDVECASRRRARGRAAGRRRRRREHLARRSRGARGARSALLLVTSGYLAAERPACPAATHDGAPRAGRLGRRPASLPIDLVASGVATFSRRLPGLQGLARRRARGSRALLARRPRRSGTSGADVAVDQHVLRHERGAREVAARPPRAPRARTRRVYVTGCGANLAGGAFAGLPDNVVVVAQAQRGDARLRRRRRRRDRLRAGRRAARPRARVREDPGRLLVLVQLLRHPARARRLAQPQRRRRARRDPPPRRAGPSRGRAHRASTSAASATAPPATTCRGSSAKRARRRGSSGCGLSSIEINHVDAELVAALRETPAVSRHLHVPLQSGDDGVLRAMGRRYTTATYLRRLAPLAGEFNLTSDVIVGFPAEDEAAFEQTLRDGRARRADEGARLPVLAAARDGDRRRRPGAARGQEGARRAASRARRASSACAAGSAKLGTRRRRARRPAGPRLRRRLLALARRRARRRARVACGPARVTRGGDPCRSRVTTASSAASSARATYVHPPTGFVAINDINPQAPVHVLVLPERHVDTFRDVGEFAADEAKRMLEFVAETAAKAGLTDYRVARQCRCKRRPDRVPSALAHPGRAEAGQRCRRSRSRRRVSLIGTLEQEVRDGDARARRRRAATRCA